MLTSRLLNSQATLNNFQEISAVEYVPGENLDIVFRLFNSQLGIRYIAVAPATVSIEILKSDGSKLSKAASSLDSNDLSIWTVSLDSTETQDIVGFNIEVTVDVNNDGTDLKKALIVNSLSKQVLSGDC